MSSFFCYNQEKGYDWVDSRSWTSTSAGEGSLLLVTQVGQSSRGGKTVCILGHVSSDHECSSTGRKGISAYSNILRKSCAQGRRRRYMLVKKFRLALVVANRKLRPYFLAHGILVYTHRPLKQVLQKNGSCWTNAKVSVRSKHVRHIFWAWEIIKLMLSQSWQVQPIATHQE